MQIVIFQTIQYGMSTQFNCKKNNISITSYSFYLNNSNSDNSVKYKYWFCVHTIKYQKSSILNN